MQTATGCASANAFIGARPAAIRFDRMPNEILLGIVAWLDAASVRALGAASRPLRGLLESGELGRLRVAERIQCVVTTSDFARTVYEIAQRPASQRAALMLQLAERLRLLHPGCRQAVEPLLITLVPQDAAGRLRCHLDLARRRAVPLALRDGNTATALPPLAQIVARPVAVQVDLLPRWIAAAGSDIDRHTLEQWRQIVSGLPAPGRARVLIASLSCVCIGAASEASAEVEWPELAEWATAYASDMATGEADRLAVWRAVAQAVARAGGTSSHYVEGERRRRQLWEDLLGVVDRLSPPAGQRLLEELARYPLTERLPPTMVAPARSHGMPGWQLLVDVAATFSADPSAYAEVLCAMFDRSSPDVAPNARSLLPLRERLIALSCDLPDAPRSRVLAAVLRHGVEVEEDHADRLAYAKAWQAVHDAPRPTDPACEGRLVAALAQSFGGPVLASLVDDPGEGLPGTLRSLWTGLLERAIGLPSPHWVAALQGLAVAAADMPEWDDADAVLLRQAQALDEPDRAALLRTLLKTRHRTVMKARDWQCLVTMVGDLPGRLRQKPVQALVHHLLVSAKWRPEHGDGEDAAEGAATHAAVALSPADYLSSLPPRDEDEALAQASAALQWLPMRALTHVLQKLATRLAYRPWDRKQSQWLLEHARHVPSVAQRAAIVTRVTKWMAKESERDSYQDEMFEFLPAALRYVTTALPLELASTALMWLHEAAIRWGPKSALESIEQLLRQRPLLELPPYSMAVTGKRKEPPGT